MRDGRGHSAAIAASASHGGIPASGPGATLGCPQANAPQMTPGHRNRLHVQQHEATKLEDPCGRCSRS